MNRLKIVVVLALALLAPAVIADSDIAVDPQDEQPRVAASGEKNTLINLEEEMLFEASGCSAELDCGNTTISCTGNQTCYANGGGGIGNPNIHVSCDGVKTYCPDRCSVTVFCDCIGSLTCGSAAGDCDKGTDWVSCNGNTWTCEEMIERSPFCS